MAKGKATKKAASIIFLVTRNLGDGLRLFLTAIALEQVLGWSLPACVVLIGLATIAYTVFGGMRSVIWIDCVQLLVYLVGGFAALYIISSRLPEGFQTVAAFAANNDKFRVLEPMAGASTKDLKIQFGVRIGGLDLKYLAGGNLRQPDFRFQHGFRADQIAGVEMVLGVGSGHG